MEKVKVKCPQCGHIFDSKKTLSKDHIIINKEALNEARECIRKEIDDFKKLYEFIENFL